MQSSELINQRLLNNLQAVDFAGYDIFDGLNSPLIECLGLNRLALVRLAWIQAYKRSPVNFRQLTGVPRQRNAKGIALIILGLLEDYCRNNDSSALETAVELGDWLLANRCDSEQWQYFCWGYHFPWQARAFYVPLGKPNIITTCYVARALWALSIYPDTTRFADAANNAGQFIIDQLYTEQDNRCYFAYIPGEKAFVHNASLWGAAVVAEAGQRLQDQTLSDRAYQVCMQSVSEQREDGAWVYGGRTHHQFIDGFHTGYNLEALSISRDALGVCDFDSSIDIGIQFYRQHFFRPDGQPKYYHNATYPIDMHLVSQAVLTLLKVGQTQADLELASMVLDWAIKNMYIEKTGYFRCQINRWYNNNICYIRWTQAWAYYAIAFFHNHNYSKRI
ncbi:MAG: aspartate-semialdehyde dehydrogenase [Gammaproteobacteria bacterium]|nr:aspartate-semialdehyde dehydrogenase [Gammaproteobacteria bacterium]